MRTGRRGVNPGDDDKKKKKSNGTQSIQEVTVSAKKSDRQDQKVQLEGAETTNIFYADIKDPFERSKAAIKYENANYEKAAKNKNMVSLSSIKLSNPKSYELLSNSMQPNKDAYGEIDDYLVDKKYANVSSYKDIYGYDYDPTERKKAAKADKLDEFEKKMGGRTQYAPKSDFGYHIKYSTIEKKEETPTRLPIKKAITGKLATLPEKDKEPTEDWSIRKPSKFHGTSISYRAPSLNREKAVKGEIRKKTIFGVGKTKSTDVKFGGGVQTNSGRFGIKKLAYAAVANPLQKARFKSEVSQGKAYFGNYEGESNAKISESKEDLKDTKKQMRSAISDVRKGTSLESTLSKSERIKGYRDEIKDARSGIRTANKASKYLENLRGKGIHSYGTTVNEVNPGRGIGKIQYATPDKFQGYADFARAKKNKR